MSFSFDLLNMMINGCSSCSPASLSVGLCHLESQDSKHVYLHMYIYTFLMSGLHKWCLLKFVSQFRGGLVKPGVHRQFFEGGTLLDVDIQTRFEKIQAV